MNAEVNQEFLAHKLFFLFIIENNILLRKEVIYKI